MKSNRFVSSAHVEITGSLADFTNQLSSADNSDDCDRLFTASSFLCATLEQREELSEELGLSVNDTMLAASQLAVRASRGDCIGNDDPFIVASAAFNDTKQFQFGEFSTGALAHLRPDALWDTVDQSAQDTIILPLANGSIPAILAAYAAIPADLADRVPLLPIKFSRYKRKQYAPDFHESQLDYLRRHIADGKDIIIFDDDVSSGDTIHGVINYLIRHCRARPQCLTGHVVLRHGRADGGSHTVLTRTVEGLIRSDL